MKLYGKLKRLKRGITIGLSVTFRCNYACEYCPVKKAGKLNNFPNEALIDEYIEKIDNFPVKVREIYIGGGEPTLRPDLPELVNRLIDKGYFVILFTNLTNNSAILSIKNSKRLIILATYHHHANISIFNARRNILIHEGYRVDVDEIGYKELHYSKVKPLVTDKEMRKPLFRIDPDNQIHVSCEDLVNG